MIWTALIFVFWITTFACLSYLLVPLFRKHVIAVALFAVLILSITESGLALLGSPRPINLTLVSSGTVIAYVIDEPRFIYLWILPTGAESPMYLVMPFTKEKAQDIESQSITAKKSGTTVEMSSAGGVMKFWPKPQPPNPPKYKDVM